MNKIPLESFLNSIDALAALKPSYRLGGDGSDGTCDCIGLIIGGIRRSGGSWSGIHGSNWAARNAVESLAPIASTSDLTIGEAVFKAASPGENNHQLPSRYASHPDQRDYYHVGIVRSVTPLRIQHCTGPGVITDKKLGKWRFHGWLKTISPQGGTPMPTTAATVHAPTGSTVNLRTSPEGPQYQRIPVGSAVTVHQQQDGWSRITWGEYTGWMKDDYLIIAPAADTLTITLPRDTALLLQSALTQALG